MKKPLAIFLIGMLLLGLTGCKGTELQQPEFNSVPYVNGNQETSTEVQWCAQYIRTNGSQDGATFPNTVIIPSMDALNRYYEDNKDTFWLERNPNPASDSTVGFLDACDRYDEAFFEKNFLIFILLEEGSGSVRHEVQSIEQTADRKISVSIHRNVPEIGTADMAQWHILIELSRDVIVETSNDILVYFDSEDHSHQLAAEAQTVADPVTGYCGNTQTTLYIGEKTYSFMYDHSVTLTDILINLDYDPHKLCKCLPEYTVDTEFHTGYGINLSQGYARCEQGQADLTQEQVDTIAAIILWAETTNCRDPFSG